MIAILAASGIAQSKTAAALAQVSAVYLLPMSHGMDQYLAHALTKAGLVQVVTDPAKADALLTDHLGAAFEASVKELYPEVAPVAAPAKSDAEKPDKDKDASTDAKPDPPEMRTAAMDRPTAPGRNRGMVFLVKRGTGEVLWSAYHDPATRRAKELNRAAGKLSNSLKKAMTLASPTAFGGK